MALWPKSVFFLIQWVGGCSNLINPRIFKICNFYKCKREKNYKIFVLFCKISRFLCKSFSKSHVNLFILFNMFAILRSQHIPFRFFQFWLIVYQPKNKDGKEGVKSIGIWIRDRHCIWPAETVKCTNRFSMTLEIIFLN